MRQSTRMGFIVMGLSEEIQYHKDTFDLINALINIKKMIISASYGNSYLNI